MQAADPADLFAEGWENSQNKLTYPCPKNIILLLRKEKTLENLRQSAYYGERRREIAR